MLDPITLHPRLLQLLFVLDPVRNTLSDGSDFPLSIISSLRSVLAEMIADESVDKRRIGCLNSAAGNNFTTKEKRLSQHLRNLAGGGAKSVWTKEHRHSYTFRACVNKQRLCITIDQGQMIMVPLHPLFRIARSGGEITDGEMSSSGNSGTEVIPTELQHWVAAKGVLTKNAPYNADIWSVPAGQR